MRTRTRRRTLGAEQLESRALLSTFAVAPTGSDSALGTESAPWRTLQHAANVVRAGDTVTVRAGNYAGFDLRASGSAAAPITFQADPGVVINARNPVTQDGINLEGASYVTLQGFQVVGMPRAGIRSVVNGHVTIRDNIVDQNARWGIFTGFSEDLLIEGNTATRSQIEHGIYVSNSADRPVIRNNLVWGNHASGIHMNGDVSQGGDGIISGAVVEGNTIHDNGVRGGSGINGDGVQGAVIRNNLLYNNHASGISLFRIDGGGESTGNFVLNNTVIVAADGRWALNIQQAATGNTARNNILYNNGPFRGSLDISTDSLPGFVSDHNVVMDRFTTDGGSSRLTLSQWRSRTGQDVHSLVATPGVLFVDPANNNYRLSATSPAIDAGTPLGAPATDLDGARRPSGAGHDIGAYEFQAAPANPPEVQTVLMDDNTGQRSAVRSLTVTFSTAVTLDAGAFQLANLPGGARLVVSPASGSSRTFVITFDGAGIVGGSLPDGRYSLVVDAAKVKDAGGLGPASNRTVDFHRFFGDANGDGAVDAVDYLAFRRTYLTGIATGANAIHDSNGDGIFTRADLDAFTARMRRRRL